ncbi:MAG TPA: DOMON-like domain-containing protein [Allosphingosinicella sp.]|jgi:hypothetical protein
MTLCSDLEPHPSTGPGPVAAIRAEVGRVGPSLSVTYALAGDVGALWLPERQAPERTAGLWQHTCFELFLKRAAEEGYLEFNFSPSGQWAAYQFDGYRSGKRDFVTPAPAIRAFIGPEALQLSVSLSLPPGVWDIGLSAVIEDKQGRISYWALAHPPGDPDFHDGACFTLELPAARRA